jgi:hypothetical protein
MGDETVSPARRKERLDVPGRVLRRDRIFARLREGYAYDEIAREEQVTPERVRQIVREALAGRIVEDETDHAKRQLMRLAQATQIASGAGRVNATPALLKVIDRVDRYQRAAKVNQVYDDEARKRLFDKRSTTSRPTSAPTSRGLRLGGRLRARIRRNRPAGERKRKKGVRGPRKTLKGLHLAKEIQGFPWLKFGRALLDSAPILLDLGFPWSAPGDRREYEVRIRAPYRPRAARRRSRGRRRNGS